MYSIPFNRVSLQGNEKKYTAMGTLDRPAAASRPAVDFCAIAVLIAIGIPLFGSQIPLFPPFSDYIAHYRFAERLARTAAIHTPHFLFELMLIPVKYLVPGFTFVEAGFFVTLLFYLFATVLLYLIIRRAFGQTTLRTATLSMALSLGLMIVAPIGLLTLDKLDFYFGYIAISVYHNPTSVILKPIAILLFLYALKIFRKDASKGTVLLSAVLVILGAVAKPSYTICLLPALGLLCGYFLYRRRPFDYRLAIGGILLPAVLILGWQFYFTYSGSGARKSVLKNQSGKKPPVIEKMRSNKIIFAPFKVVSYFSSLLFPKFLLSIAFPLIVLLLFWKTASKDPGLILAWPTFVVSLFYNYFLAEEGHRMYHYNFAWGAQISLFILFLSSILFLIRKPAQRTKLFACFLVFGIHVLSGVIWYYIQIHYSRVLWPVWS